jgi:hypothetical protein
MFNFTFIRFRSVQAVQLRLAIWCIVVCLLHVSAVSADELCASGSCGNDHNFLVMGIGDGGCSGTTYLIQDCSGRMCVYDCGKIVSGSAKNGEADVQFTEIQPNDAPYQALVAILAQKGESKRSSIAFLTRSLKLKHSCSLEQFRNVLLSLPSSIKDDTKRRVALMRIYDFIYQHPLLRPQDSRLISEVQQAENQFSEELIKGIASYVSEIARAGSATLKVDKAQKKVLIYINSQQAGEISVSNIPESQALLLSNQEKIQNTRIFPNPANNVAKLEVEQPFNTSTIIELYSSAGVKVLQTKANQGETAIQIDVSGIASGLYYAKYQHQGQSITLPLVIQK